MLRLKAEAPSYKKKAFAIFKIIESFHHFFPDLLEELQKITDPREKCKYDIAEIVFAAIAMHILKVGTRNSINNLKKINTFAINYIKMFGLRLPSMDTVHLVMKKISNEELEKLRVHLVAQLIEKKIFSRYRIMDSFHNISVDGTGIVKIEEANIKNFPKALFKCYRKETIDEKIVYFINVLEAKLVCGNGFCISIGSVWLENPDEEYDKQDCELKAFIRLAEQLKKNYPRLPICIVGDALYPNQTIFDICRNNNWQWIFTLKNGKLPSIWEQVNKLGSEQENNHIDEVESIRIRRNKKTIKIESVRDYFFVNFISYCGHTISWAKMIEFQDGKIIHEFVYLSSIALSVKNAKEVINNGRMRFKIENEGFNTQKNLGYSLSHKLSRSSEIAMKNYYTCLQIGHMINQLFELQSSVKKEKQGRNTLVSLWTFIKSYLVIFEILDIEISTLVRIKRPVVFE